MTLADTANAAVTRDALAAAQGLTNPTQGDEMTDHRAEADRHLAIASDIGADDNLPEVALAQAHLLAAIHDEQQLQTGTLADLRGAIDDLAEVLRPKAVTISDIPAGVAMSAHVTSIERTEPETDTLMDWCAECGCSARVYTEACKCDGCLCGVEFTADADQAEPEPETVTVTLPRDVVSLAWARLDVAARACGGDTGIADRHAFARDALADALDVATATQEADQ